MQHVLDGLYVGFVNDGFISQVAFALGAFLGQNMTVISVVSFDFSRAGKRKSFLRTRFGF